MHIFIAYILSVIATQVSNLRFFPMSACLGFAAMIGYVLARFSCCSCCQRNKDPATLRRRRRDGRVDALATKALGHQVRQAPVLVKFGVGCPTYQRLYTTDATKQSN